jgi:arylsulfatase A-like enzyme
MGARGDAIMEADWCVGELVSELEKLGLLENTMIIFTSDNGPVLNDGYQDFARERAGNHDPCGGLRGGKYSLFDAGTHVPFFVCWKGKIQPKQSDALVCQLDLLASFSQLLNYPLKGSYDSENLLPALLGKSDTGRKNLIVEAQGKLAIRQGDYILLPPYSGPERNLTGNELGNMREFCLYDVASDTAQIHNVAARYPEKLEEMKTAFFKLTKGYYKAEVDEVELK